VTKLPFALIVTCQQEINRGHQISDKDEEEVAQQSSHTDS